MVIKPKASLRLLFGNESNLILGRNGSAFFFLLFLYVFLTEDHMLIDCFCENHSTKHMKVL